MGFQSCFRVHLWPTPGVGGVFNAGKDNSSLVNKEVRIYYRFPNSPTRHTLAELTYGVTLSADSGRRLVILETIGGRTFRLWSLSQQQLKASRWAGPSGRLGGSGDLHQTSRGDQPCTSPHSLYINKADQPGGNHANSSEVVFVVYISLHDTNIATECARFNQDALNTDCLPLQGSF